jgi:tetratricopeptide (TPR) repeat protein
MIGIAACCIALYFFVIVPFRANRLLSHTIFNRSLPAAVATGRLERAVRLDGSRPLYFYHLGTTYRKEARQTADTTTRATSLKLAKDALTHAIDLVPVDAEHYIKLANLLVVMVRESPPLASTNEVFQALQKALALDPYNADYLLIGADIATALGDTRRASQWAFKSVQLYPHFAPPHAQLGFISLIEAVRLAKDRKHAEIKILAQKAIDDLERSLPLFWANHTEKKKTAEENLAKGYLFRAKAEERLGEFDAAEATYQYLLKLQPDHKEGLEAFKVFRERQASSKPEPHPVIEKVKN